jgi:hypothetical protein
MHIGKKPPSVEELAANPPFTALEGEGDQLPRRVITLDKQGRIVESEASIQATIVDYLHARGEWVFENRSGKMNALASRLSGGKTQEKGSPDIFVFLGNDINDIGVTLAIEVKRPGEKQSKEQRIWQSELEGRGHLYLLVDNVDDVIAYMEGGRAKARP